MNKLEVAHIITQKDPDYKWVQLKETHHNLESIMDNLEKALKMEIKQTLRLNHPKDNPSVMHQNQSRNRNDQENIADRPKMLELQKFDMTHDFTGTFYIPGDWKKKRDHILKLLE